MRSLSAPTSALGQGSFLGHVRWASALPSDGLTRCYFYSGTPAIRTPAIACAQTALRLDPRPPGYYFWILGLAQFTAGQYEAAVKTLRNEATYRTESRNLLAAALVQLDKQEEACEEAKLYLTANPNFKITHWVETQPYRDIAMRDRIAEGMRKAGLPE